MSEELENIEDYKNLQLLKPFKNKRIKTKKILPSIENNKSNIKKQDIDNIQERLSEIERRIIKLEKLTSYLDYLRIVSKK